MGNVHQTLADKGICAISPLYSNEKIAEWNTLLDDHIQCQHYDRRYANAEVLHNMGMIKDIFNENMRDLIKHLMPDAVLYHCHVYEIDGGQKKTHIHAENGRQGWHRDEECLPDFEINNPQFVSIFVYLTDVAEDSGPFEIVNYPPSKGLEIITNRPSFKMLGNSGYSFIFDRVYMHRANPNFSPVSRRVLKLSIQPNNYDNIRIGLQEFTEVLKKIEGTDEFVEQLFGKNITYTNVTRGKEEGLPHLPQSLPLVHNSKIGVGLGSEAIRHFKRAWHKTKRVVTYRLGRGCKSS
jgi:hypothetical protein